MNSGDAALPYGIQETLPLDVTWTPERVGVLTLVALGIVLLVGLLFWLKSFLQERNKRTVTAPGLSVKEQLHLDMEALSYQESQGAGIAFASDVNLLLRRTVECFMKVPASEWTTEEFARHFDKGWPEGLNISEPYTSQAVIQILRDSDAFRFKETLPENFDTQFSAWKDFVKGFYRHLETTREGIL